MNISEDALEAATNQLRAQFNDFTSPDILMRKRARMVLRASAKYLLADAWDQGAEAGYQLAIQESPYSDYQAEENPYRSNPA